MYNKDTGSCLKVDDISNYNIKNFVREEHKKIFYKYLIDKRIWRNLKIIDNCIDVIKDLHEHGDKIYFVTSANPYVVPEVVRWLLKNFPFLPVKNRLIVMNNKKMLDIDILIDDCLNNLIGGQYYGICFAYPWNEKSNLNNQYKNSKAAKIFRCNNWLEIKEKISYIKSL